MPHAACGWRDNNVHWCFINSNRTPHQHAGVLLHSKHQHFLLLFTSQTFNKQTKSGIFSLQLGVMIAGFLSVIIASVILQGGVINIFSDSQHGGRINFWEWVFTKTLKWTFNLAAGKESTVGRRGTATIIYSDSFHAMGWLSILSLNQQQFTCTAIRTILSTNAAKHRSSCVEI